METIIDLLEKLENLIYKILVWIVLIPKTLLFVVLHPDWAAAYIKDELKDGKPRFDEYFSPIVLLLILALLPSVLWKFLPIPGVEIISPAAENPSALRTVDFQADIRFMSTSSDSYITTFWRVEKELYDGKHYMYPVLKLKTYTNNLEKSNSTDYVNYYPVDSHTIQSIFSYEFPEPGNYWVVVEADRFDSQDALIESHSSEIYIYVPPEDSGENVIVHAKTKSDEKKPLAESAINQLKSEETIFLALGLLLPPLLFTVAIKIFTKDPMVEANLQESNQVKDTPSEDQPKISRKKKDRLSEDSLKETFYVQCYYFAPLAFTFWATRYAIRFFTPDVFFRFDTDANLIVLLPMILALFWFIAVQTNEVAKETSINGGPALLIVLVCMFILFGGVSFVAFKDEPGLQDVTRKSSIWLYALLAVGLLTAYHILSIFQKRKQQLAISRGDKVVVGGIVFIIFTTMCLVLGVGPATSIQSATLEATQQMNATQSVATIEALKAIKFYTDDFKEDLNGWQDFNLGDENTLKYDFNNDNLHVQLLSSQEQTGVYFYNMDFLYANVEVETSLTDTTGDEHTVSLVCRSSDIGWYEFEISNLGAYTIYAYDYQSYTPLASGGVPNLNTSGSKNTYTAVCKDNELTLVVNGTPIVSIQEKKFNFQEGHIGIAVYSPQGKPVDVDFDYVKMSEPSSTRAALVLATPIAEITEEAATELPSSQALTEAEQYYTEEFDEDLESWVTQTLGDEKNVQISQQDGNLIFHLDPSGESIPVANIYNGNFTYTDVKLEMVNTNNGNNANTVSLLCRLTDNGWYEFSVSNSGWYGIYAMDITGAVQQGYNELTSGNSTAIRVGHATNTYTAVCTGNELSLYSNGQLVATMQDTIFNFMNGNIGLGVSGLQPLPIDVAIESLTVSPP